MRRTGSGAFAVVLLGLAALRAPVGLAADAKATPQAGSKARLVKVRPRVPEFPADVKALGDRLSATASPAVKSWSSQNSRAIAKGSGEPEAIAHMAVQSRWSHVRAAGASDTLAFIATYDAAKTLQETIKQQLDSKSEMGEMESMRLQMAMDRLSKLMSTLSNLLKKASETSQTITQNLK
jgi:hypothetical protein